MVFSSPVFLYLFLPAVLLFHLLLGKHFRNYLLLAASLFFYAWGEKEYVLLMIASIVLNYFFALVIDRAKKSESDAQKTSLIALRIAVVINLGLLLFFKYANFFVNNLNHALKLAHVSQAIVLAPVHLPLGISFFTFHALSYVIDVYRGDAPCQKNPAKIALYLSLFPQLIAGPIVRYRDVADQLTQRSIGIERFASGVRRFVVGLGKKILIANTLGAVTDKIFAVPAPQLTCGLAWLGVVCYTLQIYFDFSGYSDMAIGLGRMFGFEFLENFDYPYIARSMREFWRRWHISLTTWFRDYVYIPLGGSREGAARTYFNLLTVFFLCGLWHGASWTFLLWGLFHGFFLVLERTRVGRWIERLGALFGHVYTLLVVLVGWVLFRAEKLSYAVEYLKAMAGFGHGTGTEFYARLYLTHDVILALLVGAIGSTPVIFALRKARQVSFLGPAVEIALLSAIFMACSMQLAMGTYNPFIYFRF